tara:strand:+ start:26178 stop:26471 length:294 start_codon:yes stop_codon:yes gene_type:complete
MTGFRPGTVYRDRLEACRTYSGQRTARTKPQTQEQSFLNSSFCVQFTREKSNGSLNPCQSPQNICQRLVTLCATWGVVSGLKSLQNGNGLMFARIDP